MSALLKNKQILYLFISSFAVLFIGMGLFPILPLFAARFDATNSTTGFYLAAIYAANSLGPIVTGWLITHFSKKVVFIAGAVVGTPALLGLGAAQNFVQVIVLTSLLWFSGGVVMALVSILTGMHTTDHNRGKAFGLMAMVSPLGSLLGGAMVGRLVSWQGYAVMFTVLAVVWSTIPLIGLLIKEGPHAAAQPAGGPASSNARPPARLGATFARALSIIFLGSMAVNVSRLGSGLSMQSMQFTPEDVSNVAMVSGLIAIPITLVIGASSDRLGRKHFLFASYLFAMSGSIILINATNLWQFSLASILHLLAYSNSGAMAQAISSDIVPAQAVSRALSWMNTLGAVASIFCFAIGGLLYDLLGMPLVFLTAALLALAAGAGIEILFQPRRMVPMLEEHSKA